MYASFLPLVDVFTDMRMAFSPQYYKENGSLVEFYPSSPTWDESKAPTAQLLRGNLSQQATLDQEFDLPISDGHIQYSSDEDPNAYLYLPSTSERL